MVRAIQNKVKQALKTAEDADRSGVNPDYTNTQER
jgi:hypothetical protein